MVNNFSLLVSDCFILDTESELDYNKRVQGSIEDLHLQKLFWSQGELRAKVLWKTKRKSQRYTVTWWNGPCRNAINEYSNFKLAATTKVICKTFYLQNLNLF